jgi:hypothetical protein
MKFATLRFSFWMVSLIIGLSKSAIAEDLSPELGELLEKGLRSKGPVQLEQFLNRILSKSFVVTQTQISMATRRGL